VRKGVDRLLHRMSGAHDRRFSRAVGHYETVVSLPIYPALTEAERARVVAAAVEVLSACQ
jgi:dTDP-4-amino-4,6-dideoxygalactose transaminase